MDISSSLELLGNFGYYQLYVYLLSCVPVFNSGIVFLSLVFLSATPKYRCFIPNCDSDPRTATFLAPYTSDAILDTHNSCKRLAQIQSPPNSSQPKCTAVLFTNRTETCDQHVFDTSVFSSTVVTEFNKVCSDSYQISLGQSVFYLGVLSGAFIFGVLADRYGRQFVFKIAPVIAFGTAILSAFAPNFLVFTLSTAITAACVTAMYQTAFIIGIEFIGGKWRVWCGNIHSVLFSLGTVVLVIIAYYVRDWRRLQYIIAAPLAITLFYPWLFPESVRWQTSNGQTSKGIQTIRRAAKWNRVYIPEEYLREDFDQSGKLIDDHKVIHYGPSELFKNRITRSWTLSLFFIWFTSSLVYYGLSFQAGSIGSDIYHSFAWLAAIEIPGILVSTYLTQVFGRKKVLFALLMVGGLSCVAPAFLPDQYVHPYGSMLAIFGKSNITGAFALIYVYSVEIFPTVLRSSGLGMCSMSARIGGILAPQLIELSVFGKSVPLLISGVVAVIAGALVLILPETHNRELPETLEDLKSFKK